MEKGYQKIGNVSKFDEKFRTIVGLETLNKFCDSVNACISSGGITNVDLKAKKQIEKELKVLNFVLENTIIDLGFDEEEDAYYIEINGSRIICTKEEYELLKEVLL